MKKAMLMPVTGGVWGDKRVRWKDVLKQDTNKLGCREEDAMDRSRWKRLTRAADPILYTGNKGRMKKKIYNR